MVLQTKASRARSFDVSEKQLEQGSTDELTWRRPPAFPMQINKGVIMFLA